MLEPNKCTQFISEKEILQDGMISQKHIAESYNTFAGECVNEQLRSTFLNILDDEHKWATGAAEPASCPFQQVRPCQ